MAKGTRGRRRNAATSCPLRFASREYLQKEWLPAIEATIRPTTYRNQFLDRRFYADTMTTCHGQTVERAQKQAL